jgi:cardiolipin synthase (CMP-forming)
MVPTLKRWLIKTAIPWLRWRMFRTGVPLDARVTVTDKTFTVASAITAIRIAGLPAFVYLALGRHAWFASFLVFGTLAFLDSIDGYVARRYDQVTKIGSMMDHVADRVTIFVIALTLLAVGILPLEIVALIVVRDVLLLVIVTILGQFGRPLPTGRVPITRTGKLATMLLLVGLPTLILHNTSVLGADVIYWFALALTWCGVCLYYISFVQYVRASLTQ